MIPGPQVDPYEFMTGKEAGDAYWNSRIEGGWDQFSSGFTEDGWYDPVFASDLGHFAAIEEHFMAFVAEYEANAQAEAAAEAEADADADADAEAEADADARDSSDVNSLRPQTETMDFVDPTRPPPIDGSIMSPVGGEVSGDSDYAAGAGVTLLGLAAQANSNDPDSGFGFNFDELPTGEGPLWFDDGSAWYSDRMNRRVDKNGNTILTFGQQGREYFPANPADPFGVRYASPNATVGPDDFDVRQIDFTGQHGPFRSPREAVEDLNHEKLATTRHFKRERTGHVIAKKRADGVFDFYWWELAIGNDIRAYTPRVDYREESRREGTVVLWAGTWHTHWETPRTTSEHWSEYNQNDKDIAAIENAFYNSLGTAFSSEVTSYIVAPAGILESTD